MGCPLQTNNFLKTKAKKEKERKATMKQVNKQIKKTLYNRKS